MPKWIYQFADGYSTRDLLLNVDAKDTAVDENLTISGFTLKEISAVRSEVVYYTVGGRCESTILDRV